MTELVMQSTKGRLYGGCVNGPLATVAQIGRQCREIWNHFVRLNEDRYASTRRFMFYHEMSSKLSALIKTDPRFDGLTYEAAQRTVWRLDRALKECGRSRGAKRKGFPRYKRYSDRKDTFSFVGRSVRLTQGRIQLPKIGWLRVRGLRVPEGAKIKQATVAHEPLGWHVSVRFEAPPRDYAAPGRPAVGLDMGLVNLATLSDGAQIEHPRLACRAEERIRRLQRKHARRRKGGVNRRRTARQLARVHRTVRNARIDHMHKRTRKLVDDYAGFAVETLSFKGVDFHPELSRVFHREVSHL